MPWRPGQHAERLQLEQPYEDVPTHLVMPLTGWLRRWISPQVQPLLIRMRLDGYGRIEDARHRNDAVARLTKEAEADHDLLLDLVENLLDLLPNNAEAVPTLAKILEEGNSAYRVRNDGRGLELRIAPEVRKLVEGTVQAASRANSSGQQLAAAWNAAYGRSSDPVKAYSESIKAVESAAAPVLSPNNLKATLGTLRGDLRTNAALWHFVIDADGVETVLAMMTTLWEGQTSRHGGVNPTVKETPEAARAAVHLAATLVQWFVSGALTKR